MRLIPYFVTIIKTYNRILVKTVLKKFIKGC